MIGSDSGSFKHGFKQKMIRLRGLCISTVGESAGSNKYTSESILKYMLLLANLDPFAEKSNYFTYQVRQTACVNPGVPTARLGRPICRGAPNGVDKYLTI